MKTLLDPRKYIVREVEISDTGGWFRKENGESIPTFPVRLGEICGFLEGEHILQIDVAIPFLHGDKGEDGIIQGALESAGIAYIGADTVTGAVCADKAYTKAVAEALGIPVAKWMSVNSPLFRETARMLAEEEIGYPMFIKPSRLGSSIGAGAVRDADEFDRVYETAMEKGGCRILIEELIENKRECEVAYFSALGQTIITPASEVTETGFYSYERKYLHPTETKIEAELSENVKEKLADYSAALAVALGLRHLSRIDFFLSGDRLLFNEINTMPGFTDISLYPRMMERAGISPSELISRLIEDAYDRNF